MITQRVSLTNQDARQLSATRLHRLGTIVETADGRIFRYAGAGAVNLSGGKVVIGAPKVANHTASSVAAAAPVGSLSVSVTVGATAVTQNQYNGAFLVVVDGPGVGAAYRIEGTPAIASSGTGTIQLSESIATALTTSSKVSLQLSPFSSTIVSSGAVGFFAAGVPNLDVPATYYYWAQVGGVASVLSDGIIGKGVGATISGAVNGALAAEVAGSLTRRVATALEDTRDTKYDPVFLSI